MVAILSPQQITGLATVTGGLPQTADVFDVRDSAAGRTGGAQIIQAFDKNGSPLWSISPVLGSVVVGGGGSYAGAGIFGPFAGPGALSGAMEWDATALNHAVFRMFAGTGAPAGNLASSNVNDWYIQIGTGLFIKTGASTWTQVAGVLQGGGTNTSGSAPVIAAPGFASGVASQLSDLTRDYMTYVVIGTGGGTVTIATGPTAGVANTIVNAAVGVAGTMMAVRLPAGWFYKITLVTSTIASQIAIGC